MQYWWYLRRIIRLWWNEQHKNKTCITKENKSIITNIQYSLEEAWSYHGEIAQCIEEVYLNLIILGIIWSRVLKYGGQIVLPSANYTGQEFCLVDGLWKDSNSSPHYV